MADKGGRAREFGGECDEFDGGAEVFGAVERCRRGLGWLLEVRGVVCSFLGRVQVRSFTMRAEQGGGEVKCAWSERGEDLDGP